MFRHSTNTASFFSVLMAALIFALSLAGSTLAQGNTSFGVNALASNTTGNFNTAVGLNALFSNSIGDFNTASGAQALVFNTTGDQNTASGVNALRNNTIGDSNTASGFDALFSNTTGNSNTATGVDALTLNTTGGSNTTTGANALFSNTTGRENTANGVSALFFNTTGDNNTAIGRGALLNNSTGFQNTASGGNALASNTTGSVNTAIRARAGVSGIRTLTNATAIGSFAVVDASNKVRLGDTRVTVIEGQVAFTFPSDQTKKENFKPVDGEEVLGKIRGFELTSWNFIGDDTKEFRHYGPMAQDFFAAFGNDGIGQVGTETTINSGDLAGILMIAVQAAGEAHGGAKTHEGTDCGAGIAARGPGVTNKSLYPNRSG